MAVLTGEDGLHDAVLAGALRAHGGHRFADTHALDVDEPVIHPQAGRLTGARSACFPGTGRSCGSTRLEFGSDGKITRPRGFCAPPGV